MDQEDSQSSVGGSWYPAGGRCIQVITPYRKCSLGFEKKSFLADSDLMIESGLADSTLGSIDILNLIPPKRGGPGPFLIRRSEK